MTPFLAVALGAAVICGFMSAAIAQNKGLPPAGYMILGFLLGIIGLIIAAAARPAVPVPQPPGWYADPWGRSAWRW
jgi:hypothetical protein